MAGPLILAGASLRRWPTLKTRCGPGRAFLVLASGQDGEVPQGKHPSILPPGS
jgi:hypothetical protein